MRVPLWQPWLLGAWTSPAAASGPGVSRCSAETDGVEWLWPTPLYRARVEGMEEANAEMAAVVRKTVQGLLRRGAADAGEPSEGHGGRPRSQSQLCTQSSSL